MQLIGGINVGGTLRRDVTLKPMTGVTEMALAEIGQADISHPARVSLFLGATVATIGGAAGDPAALSVGDRQHLVRRIGVALGTDEVWLRGTCSACSDRFEIAVRQSELPVKPPSAAFPQTDVDIDGQPITVRCPTGADQEAIAHLPPDAAADALLDRLVTLPAGVTLTDDSRKRLEDAIEALSPEVTLEVAAACPDCGAEQRIDVDPYLTLTQPGQDIIDDVHRLARHYHWSEAEILSLSRARRQAYLDRIDRDRGVSANPELPGAV